MTTFLGVPVLLRGVAYGNLYLTDKPDDEDFTDADQELVELLAAQAAVAIENARLYEASTRWSRQLESLIEVSGALARETDLDVLLDLLAQRVRELLAARLVVRRAAGRRRAAIVTAAGEGAGDVTGRGSSSATRRPAACSSAATASGSTRCSTTARRTSSSPAASAPARAVGAAARAGPADRRPDGLRQARLPDARFDHDDVRLAETFASRAAVAVELSERVERDALRRIVAAQELERQRLARELHDETGRR
jgi:GAF domain-containing protein